MYVVMSFVYADEYDDGERTICDATPMAVRKKKSDAIAAAQILAEKIGEDNLDGEYEIEVENETTFLVVDVRGEEPAVDFYVTVVEVKDVR